MQYEYPEIWGKIMEKYPLSKDERRGCQTEKAMRNAARLDYGKKLLNGPIGKQEYGDTVRDSKPEI